MSFFTDLVMNLSNVVPLPLFTFLGGFLEELIAPIPSPVIMTFVGAALKTMQLPIWTLLLYGVLGGIGKTLGASVLYFLADKFEDFFTKTLGPFFGVKPHHFEKYGTQLSESKNLKYWIFGVRAFPLAPSAVVSLLSGVFKVDFKIYFWYSLIGCIVRDFIYVLVGYSASTIWFDFMAKTSFLDKLLSVLVIIAAVYYLYWLYKRRKSKATN